MMMQIRTILAVATTAIALGGPGRISAQQVSAPPPGQQSWAAPASGDPASVIKPTVESRYPGTHVLSVKPTQIAGLFEVYTGNEIVYSDAHGDFVLAGPLMDTRSRQNVTEARLNDLGRIDFAKLPFSEAIKVVKGNGKRQFAVFSDPDCPYCQQLEKTLESITDTTMYVFLYPIAALHPQAPAKARAIWCAQDRTAAWGNWMHDKKVPADDAKCRNTVDALQKLGDQLRINSTPTMFFADGRRVAGAIPGPDIEKLLGPAQ